jgi:hypothetical protein
VVEVGAGRDDQGAADDLVRVRVDVSRQRLDVTDEPLVGPLLRHIQLRLHDRLLRHLTSLTDM